jgi:hypothetical protein
MKGKIGEVILGAGPEGIGAAAGLLRGKPTGAIVLGGRIDGRELTIAMSGAEGFALAHALIAACAVADGYQVPGVELEPSTVLAAVTTPPGGRT